jgi:hypothetical protein
MRTTINLKTNAILPAKAIAAANRIPLGDVISDLVIEGIKARQRKSQPSPASAVVGLPVLAHTKGARVFGLEDVERALDEA